MTSSLRAAPPSPPSSRPSWTSPGTPGCWSPPRAGTGKTHTLVRRMDALVGHMDPRRGPAGVGAAGPQLLPGGSARTAGPHRPARRACPAGPGTDLRLLGVLPAPPGVSGRRLVGPAFEERIDEAREAIEKGALRSLESAARPCDHRRGAGPGRRATGDGGVPPRPAPRLLRVHPGRRLRPGDLRLQIDRDKNPEEYADRADLFLRWVRASYGDDLVELRLTRNFRAVTPEARTALPLGPAVQGIGSASEGADAAAERLHGELRELLLDLPDLDLLTDSFTLDSLRSFPGSCAILTRDNRQALMVSELLHTHGVPHALRRSLRERPVPYWVAVLLHRTEAATLTEERLRELLGGIPLPEGTDQDRVWRSLRGAARGAGRGTLDVTRLRRLVAERRFPDELADPEPPDWWCPPCTAPRAWSSTGSCCSPRRPWPNCAAAHYGPGRACRGTGPVRGHDPSPRGSVPRCRPRHAAAAQAQADRPLVPGVPNAHKRWRRDGVEVRAGDVCALEPADALGDALAAQLYLLERVRPGDAVTFRLRDSCPCGPTRVPVTRCCTRDGRSARHRRPSGESCTPC